MKIKRILSVWLVFLVLMSSSEAFSQADFAAKTQSGQTGTYLVEYSQDVSQEFRESVKVSLQEETKSDTNLMFHKTTSYAFSAIAYLQYINYLRAHLLKNSSKRLFINFGALII